MTTHAKLSPSGSHRWMNCPGSLRFRETESSRFADEGTFAHDIAARALLDGRSPWAYLGVKSEDGRFTVDEDMAEAIDSYVTVVRTLKHENALLYVEKKVSLFPNVWGTADAIVIDGDDWHVVDLKFGQGVLVDVKENPQLMIYGLASWNQFREKHGEPKTITLHVVQPRHHQGGHTHQKKRLKELLSWLETDLAPAVKAVMDGSETLKAGDWCGFCPAASTCPEIHRVSVEQAKSAFSNVPDVIEQVTGPMRPEDLTPDQLGQILQVLPQIESWMKNMRANAFERMMSGQDVPGYKLVRTSPHRRWRNVNQAFQVVSKKHDNPMDLVSLKSPAQVEKILGPCGKDVVASLVEKPEGQLTLAPSTDRRKAATVQPCFTPIDDNIQESEEDTDGI
jgi:hypothetical protein